MHKYKKPLERQEIELLAKLSAKDFSNFNETDVREEYIAPILTMLGYEKNTDYEVEREEFSALKDMSIQIGSKNLKLDYKFNIRKKYFWLIEAKTGKEKDFSKEDVGQAYLYSLHPDINCRFFAVCNGWLFNLYDRNRGLFSGTDTDLYQPILTIKSEELNEQKFNELYSYLGSSEIIFKVKEDILLRDIKNTLSAEIYMDRVKKFSHDVDLIINNASSEVWKNIQKNNANWQADFDKQRQELEIILSQQSLNAIVDIIFDGLSATWQLEVACKVIKDKLLPHKQSSIKYPDGFSQADMFFCHLFLEPIRTVKIEYFCNIVILLKFISNDSDLQDMLWHNYNNEHIKVSQLLDRYIEDMLNFFDNRKDIRALIILYPLYYRMAKCFLYGIGDNRIRSIFTIRKMAMDKYFTEEELSKIHYSFGHELIDVAQNGTKFIMNKFIQRAFVKQNFNVIKETPSGYSHIIHGELIKKEIYEAENIIEMLNKTIDIDKLREQLPSDEGDEMFSFDRDYGNPWLHLFIIVIRCIRGYEFSESVKNRMRFLVENHLLPINECIRVISNNDVSEKNREAWEKELSINYKDEYEQDKIISDLKTNW